MVKRTWQPKKLKRARRFGFLRRSSTADGMRILARRRAKGRTKLVTA
jgi:large subunit ribosomal protein L34